MIVTRLVRNLAGNEGQMIGLGFPHVYGRARHALFVFFGIIYGYDPHSIVGLFIVHPPMVFQLVLLGLRVDRYYSFIATRLGHI